MGPSVVLGRPVVARLRRSRATRVREACDQHQSRGGGGLLGRATAQSRAARPTVPGFEFSKPVNFI
jgi:hypothetical protein